MSKINHPKNFPSRIILATILLLFAVKLSLLKCSLSQPCKRYYHSLASGTRNNEYLCLRQTNYSIKAHIGSRCPRHLAFVSGVGLGIPCRSPERRIFERNLHSLEGWVLPRDRTTLCVSVSNSSKPNCESGWGQCISQENSTCQNGVTRCKKWDLYLNAVNQTHSGGTNVESVSSDNRSSRPGFIAAGILRRMTTVQLEKAITWARYLKNRDHLAKGFGDPTWRPEQTNCIKRYLRQLLTIRTERALGVETPVIEISQNVDKC